MIKKVIIALIFCTSLLSGCGKKIGENGELYVYNAGEYIDESLITAFE